MASDALHMRSIRRRARARDHLQVLSSHAAACDSSDPLAVAPFPFTLFVNKCLIRRFDLSERQRAISIGASLHASVIPLFMLVLRRSTVARETYMTRLRMNYSVLQFVGRSRAHIKSRIESRDEAVSLQTALRPACSD